MAVHTMWLTLGFCILSLFLMRDHQPAAFTSSTGWVRYYMVNHGCRDSPNCDPVTEDVCDVSQWSDWSACNGTCSPLAKRRRTRTCLENTCTSGTCPGRRFEHVATCSNLPCCEGYPKWLEWGSWEHPCGNPCGDWKTRRWRECAACQRSTACQLFPHMGPPFYYEFRECAEACPPKCLRRPNWSRWEEWSECSKSCGGTRTRTRECEEYIRCPDGSYCVGEWKEVSECNHKDCLPCKSKSKWKEWRSWSKCKAKCGRGSQTRKRKCKLDKKCPIPCDGESKETKSCFKWCCKKSGVKISRWSRWACGSNCTNGVSNRTRTCSAEGCRLEKKQCNEITTIQFQNCSRWCW